METRIINYLLILMIAFSIFIEAVSANINADTTKLNYTIPASPSAICGEDNRVPSYEKAVGRIVGYYSNNLSSPISIATGFIVPNGRIVSAAHVFADMEPLDDKTIIIEFEVKPSDISGNIVPSEAQHRYIIDTSSINRGGNWDGLDWAVFDVYSNSVTGLYPIDPNAQAAFLPISIDVVTQFDVNMKVIGYGYDSRNFSNNHTQQSATGLGSGFNPPNQDTPYLEYDIDTQPGCSGGPVIKDGKVIGVHRRSYAPNLCPNYGTQTAQSDFVYYLTTPSTYKYVTVQQNLENSANKAGYIGRWWNGSFLTFQNYSAFRFKIGSEQILHGDTTVISNQKYHKWSTDWDVKNHKYFIITENTDFLTSEFKTLATSSLIKYNCYEGVNIDTGNFYFKDPWYVKQASTYFDPLIGYRNLGNSAIEESVPNPFNPNYNSTGINILFKGVFLNQNPNFLPNLPNYSVKANAMQDIYLAHTGKTHKFYFQNWSADPVGSAEFQYTNSTETPVVFRDAGATVQANLKGTQLTNMLNGYSGSSQRKAVTTYDPNEVHHLTYSSMNNIWYEKETYGQSGWQWDLMNQAKPLNSIEGKFPSIDYCYASFSSVEENYFIYIVFQNKREDGKYEIRLVKFDRYGSKIIDNPVYISSLIDYNSFDAAPVVAVTRCNDGTERTKIVILWKRLSENGYPSGLCYYAGIDQGSNIQWTDNWPIPAAITGTDANSFNPSITVYKNPASLSDFHVAFQQSTSQIKYFKITYGINGTVFSSLETISTGSGSNTNAFPSITVNNTRTIKDIAYDSPKVVWRNIPGDGGVVYFRQRPKANMKWSVIYSYYSADDIFSPSLNASKYHPNGFDESFVFSWAETGGIYNRYVKGENLNLVNLLQTQGKDIQTLNYMENWDGYTFISLNNMYGKTSPYTFNRQLVDGMLNKDNIEAISSGRAGTFIKDQAELYFLLGDIKADDKQIEFKDLPDSLIIDELNALSEYLTTDAFTVNSSTNLTYSVIYGLSDSVTVFNNLGEKDKVMFKVDMIDAGTEEIITSFDEIIQSKAELKTYENISYKISLEGIGEIEIRLRLSINPNFEGEYSLRNVISHNQSLGKENYKNISWDQELRIKDYALDQNYPNPFNPTTVIRYQLPESGRVTLKVYDVLGREVKTLVDEFKESGKYEVTFDATELASGVYIYQLRAGEYLSSKKMLLLK